jgi:Cu/Ag efflux protein CusF
MGSLFLAACLALPVAAFAADKPMEKPADKPGVQTSELTVVTATVEKIDMKTREVTLKGEGGKSETIKVGPEARNLDQLKVGDKVTMKYYESVALFVAPPGGKPSVSETTEIERAAKGQKPGGVVTTVVEATATVEAVDLAKRTVTVKGPEGKVKTVKVSDAVKRLNEVKVGDQIVLRYTEAVAISVDKP